MISIYKNKVFKTQWYDKENNFEYGMILIIENSHPMQYSIDGGDTWKEVENDNL